MAMQYKHKETIAMIARIGEEGVQCLEVKIH